MKLDSDQGRWMYSLKEISSFTSVSIAFLRKEIKRGRLESVKLGKRVLVKADKLNEYLSLSSKSD